MAISSPLDLKELIPRLQDVLFAVKAAHEATPSEETRASLETIEQLVEDLMDLQEITNALQETDQGGGLVAWEEVKAKHGL